jgi:hypothetical protein
MHQERVVEKLDRRSGRQSPRLVASECSTRRETQRRSDAFALARELAGNQIIEMFPRLSIGDRLQNQRRDLCAI